MEILEVRWVFMEEERRRETGLIGFARDEEKAQELVEEFKASLRPHEVKDYTYKNTTVEVR